MRHPSTGMVRKRIEGITGLSRALSAREAMEQVTLSATSSRDRTSRASGLASLGLGGAGPA